MKTLLLILLPSLLFGQLTLTPLGLKDSLNIEKSYVVIDCPGKIAKDLYNNGVKYVNKVYKNPKFATQGDIAGDYLRFETYVPDVSSFSYMLGNFMVSAKYWVELSFKDARVKYEITGLQLTVNTRGDVNKIHGGPMDITGSNTTSFAIYKEGSLKLVRPAVKAELEQYFNRQLAETKTYLQSTLKEDW